MSAASKRPSALPDDEVLKRVRWLLEEGTVDRTFHFDNQAEKRNVTQVDIEVILAGECSVASKEYSSEHGAWKYKIEAMNRETRSV